jgi:GTP-binding protein Era
VGTDLAITSHHPQTTRDELTGVSTKDGVQFIYIDTPGLHTPHSKLGSHMNKVAEKELHDADVVLLVLDASRLVDGGPRAFVAAKPMSDALGSPARVVCALNKIDRVKPKERLLAVLEGVAGMLDSSAIVPVSAKTGDGLERLEAEIARLLPKAPKVFDDDTLTDKPMRYFVAEFVREQILRNTEKEVPHGVAVTVDEYDDRGKTHKITLTIHVDRESHKPIVLGKGGARIKKIGTLARERFEELAGVHVHLAIHVRVTRGWYEKDALLKEFGYAEGVS